MIAARGAEKAYREFGGLCRQGYNCLMRNTDGRCVSVNPALCLLLVQRWTSKSFNRHKAASQLV